MSTITTPPRGLISLFGLRDMGSVPAELSTIVAPTIDITEFALTNRESGSFGSVTTTSVGVHLPTGGTLPNTVPPGELWYVHQYTVATDVLGVGDNLRIKPLIVDGNFQFVRGAAAAGTNGDVVGAFTDRMFLATPGQSFQIYVESVTGSTVMAAYGLITRLRI